MAFHGVVWLLIQQTIRRMPMKLKEKIIMVAGSCPKQFVPLLF
jgi:hypothetical protein